MLPGHGGGGLVSGGNPGRHSQGTLPGAVGHQHGIKGVLIGFILLCMQAAQV